MEVLVQLGAGVVITYFVWQMLITIFKFFSEAAGTLAKSLDNNTDVLLELKGVIAEEKTRVRSAIEKIESRMDNGFQDTNSQLAGVKQAITEIQKSLDETIPVLDKGTKLE